MDKNYDMKGYLKKLKSSSFARIFGNTNTRWFQVSFNDKTLIYKEKNNSTKSKGSHNFSEISDFIEKVTADDRKQCDWMFGFQIVLKEKRFILFTQTITEFHSWTNAFNIICGRKKIAEVQERKGQSMLIIAKDSDDAGKTTKRNTTICVLPQNDRNSIVSKNLQNKEVKAENKVVKPIFEKSSTMAIPKTKNQPEEEKTTPNEINTLINGNKETPLKPTLKLIKEDKFEKNDVKVEKPKKSEEVIEKNSKKEKSEQKVLTNIYKDDEIIVNGLNTEKDENSKKPFNIESKSSKIKKLTMSSSSIIVRLFFKYIIR